MINLIHLKNFKCFKDQALNTKAMTLLTGINGMGKSSFIQSLLSVRQSHIQNLFPKSGLCLNGDLVKLGTAKDVLFEYADEEEIGIKVVYSDGNSGRFIFDYSQTTDVLPIKSSTGDKSFFQKSLFSDSFHYLSAERIGPRLAFDMSDFHVVQHKQLGIAGQYAVHFLATYGSAPVQTETLRNPNASSDSLMANVEAWLGEISPGTRITVTPHLGMGLVNLEYSFIRGGLTGKSHRPTNVGFGITFILPVLVALLSSSPNSLLLIENPEAHLHPRGQFILGQLMAKAANAGIQILVESHSDHFLNGLRIAVKEKELSNEALSINFFDYEPETKGSKILNLKVDSDGRIDCWPDNFFDEWEKSLERLM